MSDAVMNLDTEGNRLYGRVYNYKLGVDVISANILYYFVIPLFYFISLDCV